MKKLLILIVSLSATALCAKSIPVTAPLANPIAFATMDAAAMAVETVIVNHDQTNEWAGAIYEQDGKFYYTIPITYNSQSEVGPYGIRIPKGSKIVAIYHDHPDQGDLNEYFSPEDVDTANQLHLTSYIDTLHTRDVHRYTPGVDKTKWLPGYTGLSGKVSLGTIIGRVP